MIVRSYRPPPPLAQFVDTFWYYEGYAPAHAMERVMPSGRMAIIINLHEDRLRNYDRASAYRVQSLPGIALAGAYSEYAMLDTAQQRHIMGVHFKAGGAFPFLEPPAGEFRDFSLALDVLWGAHARCLRERLLEAPTPEAKFEVLEAALIARAKRGFERHPAVDYALRAFDHAAPAQAMAVVTDRIGLSRRRFAEVFTREVGLTPKLYWRMQRFQRVLHGLRRGAEVDWIDRALGCGYYDQAHFIHDFRNFSGLSPGEFLPHRDQQSNHVPMAD